MLKRVFGKKLSRGRGSRRALFASLTRDLVLHGKIVTTKAKAKAVQPFVEKVMTQVTKNSISSRRKVLAMLKNDREVTQKLFQDYLKLAEVRKSGFTRIVRMVRRLGDQAEMARLEFVEKLETPVKEVKKAKDKKK